MKKLFLLLTLFLLLCAPGLKAQDILPPTDYQELIRTYPNEENGVLGQMIAAPDGGFYGAGSIPHYAYIARVSSCGDVSWFKGFLQGDETRFMGIARLPSGNLVAVGDCLNCVPGDTSRKALVLVTDANGELIAQAKFGNTNFDAIARGVTVTAEGKIAVTGSVVWASFLSPTRAYLRILDEDLATEHYNEYNNFYYDTPFSVIQTADGGYAMAGSTAVNIATPAQTLVVRTDGQGQLLWKHYSDSTAMDLRAIAQGENGNLVALGRKFMGAPAGLNGYDAYLAAYDLSTGELLAEKTHGSDGYYDAGLSLNAVEGGFLAGGFYGEPSQENWNRRDWVFFVDNNLDDVWNYYRDGYLYSHNLVNAVPLSPDGKDFAYISGRVFFDSRYTDFVKVTRDGNNLQLSKAPLHYQLVSRDLATNMGTVTYEGIAPAFYDELRLDVFRNDALLETHYDMMPGGNFSFEVEIEAELANYELRLTGHKNGRVYLESNACDVVAGDAILIQGQSNAVAHFPFFGGDTAYHHHTNPFVRNFGLRFAGDTLYSWRREEDYNSRYADNVSGQWGLVMGDKIVQEHGIPVAIINGGIGGISIDSMMPNPVNHADLSKSYGRYLKRVNQSGLADNIRAMIMFQGETNAAGWIWDSADAYFQKFAQLDGDWAQDFPSIAQRYLFQIRPGLYFAGATLHTCLQISEAQRRIADNSPGWQIMSATGMNHDGSHYYYENGYKRAGDDIYRLLAKDLYNAPSMANIHPPAPDSAWFSNPERTKISLRFHHANDAYVWTPGWEGDFYIDGDSSSFVLNGQITGNVLTLDLSGEPGPGLKGLSYTSHPEGDACSVKNANGIGLLTFYRFPVAEPANPSFLAQSIPSKIALPIVSPNPATDYVSIQVSGELKGMGAWTVFDSQGRLYREFQASGGQTITLLVGDWPSGVYHLIGDYQGERVFSRVVKQ